MDQQTAIDKGICPKCERPFTIAYKDEEGAEAFHCDNCGTIVCIYDGQTEIQ